MTLITQDGRKIKLHRWDRPFFGAPRINYHYNEIYCTLLDEAGKPIKYHGTIGRYFDAKKSEELVTALRTAWNNDEAEFTLPQDTDTNPIEALEDFAEKHGLTLCRINEVGYSKADTARNLHIWQTTDEFERRNILIVDENGSYEKSLAKWKALQRKIA